MSETKLYDVFWRQNFSNSVGLWNLIPDVAADTGERAIQIALEIIGKNETFNCLPIDVRVYEETGLWGQASYIQATRWVTA